MESFVFVKDLEATMDLFEGRLSSVISVLCAKRKEISFQTVVLAIDYSGYLPSWECCQKALKSQKSQNSTVWQSKNGFSLKICRDCDELNRAAAGWIDRYIVPIGSKVMSGEIDQLPLEQRSNWSLRSSCEY
ncbi:MAG: hypothetical protein U0Z44_16595 [Kouleothrix sp.]